MLWTTVEYIRVHQAQNTYSYAQWALVHLSTSAQNLIQIERIQNVASLSTLATHSTTNPSRPFSPPAEPGSRWWMTMLNVSCLVLSLAGRTRTEKVLEPALGSIGGSWGSVRLMPLAGEGGRGRGRCQRSREKKLQISAAGLRGRA